MDAWGEEPEDCDGGEEDSFEDIGEDDPCAYLTDDQMDTWWRGVLSYGILVNSTGSGAQFQLTPSQASQVKESLMLALPVDNTISHSPLRWAWLGQVIAYCLGMGWELRVVPDAAMDHVYRVAGHIPFHLAIPNDEKLKMLRDLFAPYIEYLRDRLEKGLF
ncbi:hypothetical protein KIPB_000984 [Kipferlia bialata]|uniref:Uncharacterized protein n=1 Tax=Kipferlia bialata TaxID=797122 RepID=A0A9K3CPC5_9EUKA|nr:hypothetical protein KIPB_000984 [Kipferlia bialata]|eukprot:g984.t1